MSKHQANSQSTQKIEELFKHQISQMKQYAEQTHQIKDLIKDYKAKGEDSLKRLIKQLELLNIDRRKHELTVKELEEFHKKELSKGNDLRNEYIDKKKQRVALADKIDIKALSIKSLNIANLEIDDRKSESHEVFKWILSVIYREPVAKYYWGNFKQQAFKEDKGVDFKERMGKISATDIKQDQKVITQKLVLNRDKLINHVDFPQDVRQTIKNILQIANLIFQGTQIAKKTKELQVQDAKSRDDKIIKEQIFKKAQAKCSAVQDRINLNQKYLHLLSDLENSMNKKNKQYEQGAKQGSKVISELKSLNSQGSKSTYLQTIKKDPQVCLLF